jgi:hypothetical protein
VSRKTDINWAALDPALIDRVDALRAARGEPPVEREPDSEAAGPTPSDELMQSIAEHVCGFRAEEAMVAQLRHLLKDLKSLFDAARTESSPKQIRDALEELASSLSRASAAVLNAPQEPYFFEEAVRRETGANSTKLANGLLQLSKEVSARLLVFEVPRARNVNDEKLCAHSTRLLFDKFSKEKPTITPGGAFITAAELVAVLCLGEDESRSMTTACRAVLEGQFPATQEL